MRQGSTLYGYVNEVSSFSQQTPWGSYVNETSVPPPATQYVISGPASGVQSTPSDEFTSLANGSTTATVTVSDGGQGGSFTPSATFLAKGGTFRYVAATPGAKTLSFTNNGGLTNSTSVTFDASVYIAPATVSVVSQSAPSGQLVTFVVTTSNASTVDIVLTALGEGSTTQEPRTFNVVSGNNTISYDNIPPGSYTVQLLAFGGGSSGSATGSNIVIAGVSGGGDIEFQVPAAPAIGQSQAGDGFVDVFFTEPTDTGSNDVLDYTATLSTGESAVGSSSPVRVPASNGVPRVASVKARSAVGFSATSNESNEVTPEGVYIPTVSVRFVREDGVPILQGTQLSCAWFDQSSPEDFLAPTWKGVVVLEEGETIIALEGSDLVTGGIGWLIATNSDGMPDTIHKAFSGPVFVQ